MRLGSLFSGIGGLDIACEQAFGAAAVWQVEGIDLRAAWADERHPVSRKRLARLRKDDRHGAYNRRVLARHWPEAEQFADVRAVGAHNLAPVDVICGGFPCQDLSVAGKGGGLDGARSGLYAELYRIVCEMRPQYVVIENVPGLLKYQDRLAADFNAAGYGLRWQPLAACNVGAPHRRKRVFVLCTRGSTGSTLLDAPAIGDAVGQWCTPTKAIGDGGQSSRSGARRGELLLTGQARAYWPTAAANPFDGERLESWIARRDRVAKYSRPISPPLSIAVRMERAQTWPTARAQDGKHGYATKYELERDRSKDLLHVSAARAAQTWPTPTATAGDSKSSGSRSLPASGAHAGTSLTDAVRPDRVKHDEWPTPTTQDAQNNGGAAQHRRHALPLNAIVGGALNPEWVELLMGLPSGWSCASGDAMAWPGAHSWPVGRGVAQPDSEPVRLVPARSVPDRALRLRSIGNGVVPQQAMAALALLMEGPRQGSLFT